MKQGQFADVRPEFQSRRHPARTSSSLWVGVILWMFFSSLAGAQTSLSTFFRPAQLPNSQLSADRVYPQGRLFPFSFFSVHGEKDLRQLAERHVPLSGPVYLGKSPQTLTETAAAGMQFIYTIHPKDEDGSHWVFDTLPGKTDEEMIAGIRHEVELALAHPNADSIAWWALAPEELKSWRTSEMRYLELATRTIRELDPRHRPVWMYDPAHRAASGLMFTGRHLDIVGKGMYVNAAGRKDQRVWCRWTIEQERAAIVATNPIAIPIAVPEMYQSPPEAELHLIPAWVRHDTYCSLVAGAKGMVVFSFARRNGFEVARAAYLDAYLEVAEQLCGPRQLGQVFLFSEPRDDLAVQVVDGPKTVELLFPNGGVREPVEYPSVSWLNVAYGKDRYLFVVNSANEPVRIEVRGLPASGLITADAFGEADPTQPNKGYLTHDLPALGVAGWRFSAK